MDIRAGQKLAWENKVVKGFNTTDVPLEFCLLQGEVAEAFDAWRKDRGTIGEELADVAIFLFSLAAMTGVDLQLRSRRRSRRTRRVPTVGSRTASS